MPLTLLPPINLSSAREMVKFEVTCTDRPDQPRPTLLSRVSSSSSRSASTEGSVSSSSRKNRPSLSPEALLIHAFGPTALNRLSTPAISDSTTSSIQRNSSGPLSSSVSSALSKSSRVPSSSPKRGRKDRHDYHPPPPPFGTFRSVPKSAKPLYRFEGKLPLAELMPFSSQPNESQDKVKGIKPSCKCERNSEREPPMSLDIWREKVEERRQWRRLLHLKTPMDELHTIPLDIDCRPLEGSMPVPPRTEGIPGRSKRNYSSPALSDPESDPVNGILKEREERLIEKRNKPSDRGELSPRRRNSMVEMQEIGDLIKQCNSICLEND